MSDIPAISQTMTNGFLWFSRRYLRKHFHAFALNRSCLQGFEFSERDALVVYANHPSWWDPISALVLARQVFPKHRVYAPIDARALQKYKMFSRMGFFGVSPSRAGAIEFLRRSQAILSQPGSSIWLTPEGRFVDPRESSAPLAAGLSHLATRLATQNSQVDTDKAPRQLFFIPCAVEYAFWEERKPEALCWFGRPVCVAVRDQASDLATEQRGDKAAWNRLLTDRLRRPTRFSPGIHSPRWRRL